jgi:Pilus assembly protein, PilO
MSKLSKRDSTLLIIIGVIAVVGGMFWFYVKPAKADLKAKQQASLDAQDRVDALQTELSKLTKKATKPVTVRISDELRLAKAYPYSEDITSLILQIEDVAKQTKVSLGEASPAGGTDYAGVTGTPFTISVKGKYFNVQDFLYRLHNRVMVDGNGKLRIKGRMLAVTKADLTPGDGGAAASGAATAGTSASTEVNASITVVAFSRTAGASAGQGAVASQPAAAPASNGGTTS